MSIYTYILQTSDDLFNHEQLIEMDREYSDHIFSDNFGEQKQLNLLLQEIKENDKIVVYQLSCLGKTINQLEVFVRELQKKKIFIKSVKDGIDTSLPTGDLYIDILTIYTNMERMVNRENTKKGLERARKKGKIGGRPKLSKEKIKQIQYLYSKKSYSIQQICEECQVSEHSVAKYTRSLRK